MCVISGNFGLYFYLLILGSSESHSSSFYYYFFLEQEAFFFNYKFVSFIRLNTSSRLVQFSSNVSPITMISSKYTKHVFVISISLSKVAGALHSPKDKSKLVQATPSRKRGLLLIFWIYIYQLVSSRVWGLMQRTRQNLIMLLACHQFVVTGNCSSWLHRLSHCTLRRISSIHFFANQHYRRRPWANLIPLQRLDPAFFVPV